MQFNPFALALAVSVVFSVSDANAGELVGPGVISTGLQETSAAVSPDGNTLYFMRSDFAEKDDTILVSHRREGRWSTPEVVAFSGEWHDSEPAMAPDGKRLYFVSNRPAHPGEAPVTAEMGGQHFPGSHLWYVEQQADGCWGRPVHVDGSHNDGAMIYNPSVAANGDIYFSAHREDSGKLYQIYVARRTTAGYAAPQRVDLGDTDHNRMDPSVDPEQRYLVYAGNEGDSLGSADIYIAFRQSDGRWGKPIHLPGEVNSASLENAPSIGRRFGELYVSSNREDDTHFPKPKDVLSSLQQRLEGPLNGSRNLWLFDISDVLKEHGIEH
ncbi:MAG TPA: hypothetical protein VFG49_11240 [Dyella sp.]|uniref:TolB family protein n=1 Tax=Dyella sp. TaxID=1869338 RepID=UPI002D766B41|nr:hypothetical protein [Dyella sp.]HET6554100.1 hypothetical protein [Dyella sp.]